MKYLSVSQVAENWGMTSRRVQVLCNEGRIEGAQKVGCVWTIPENATKPIDARKKICSNKNRINSAISISREWAMPNKNTFEIKPINELILDEMTDGIWIDPFANRNKLANITNDLNMEFDTDYHLDALDFLKLFESNSIDGVLYDPPYSPRQVSECYNNVGLNVTWDTTKASFWSNHKKEISRIVKLGGKVITFGWNSGGIGFKYGFEIERILLVSHGGWHNDTICTVERKTHEGEYVPIKITEQGKQISKHKDNINDIKLISQLQKLPYDYWDFRNDEVREYTHGIHNYPAMMVSPISRNIIRIMKDIININAVLDPFAGSGTVLVESMLAGVHDVYGSDINPLALFLSKVKTTPLDMDTLQSKSLELFESISNKYQNNRLQIDGVDDIIKNGYGLDLTSKTGWGNNAYQYLCKYVNDNSLDIDVPNFKNIGYWFKPKVILMLSIIRKEIDKVDDVNIKDFFYVAFSETIRFVSNRRNGEFKLFRMTAQKVNTFSPDVIKEFMTILNRNISKMNQFVVAYNDLKSTTNVKILNTNAEILNNVPSNYFDLIITSPPYGDSRTTVAYGEYSRLSLQWLNLYNLDEKDILSIDKKLMGGIKYRNGFDYQISSETLRIELENIKDVDIERAGDVYSFYLDLSKSIETISNKTKSGGYQFWVVGNRTVKGQLLETDKIIQEISTNFGLEYVYTINRNIVNKVMPSLNSPTNQIGQKVSTMTNEHIVILRKI